MVATITGRTSQVSELVVYGDCERTPAWTFELDGHIFYVLNLGDEGTFLYDKTSGGWCEFATLGSCGWNMHRGIMWNGRIIAADETAPIIYELDPDAVVDQGILPIEHAVTGGLPARSLAGKRVDSFRLAASVGKLGVDGATMRLRFSDDFGNTWSAYRSYDLLTANYAQHVAWLSLGTMKAPGRVFEVSDSGGLIRIDGANADIEGVTSGQAG
jgi:hypothetical protein